MLFPKLFSVHICAGIFSTLPLLLSISLSCNVICTLGACVIEKPHEKVGSDTEDWYVPLMETFGFNMYHGRSEGPLT